jgi:hypothetical protein
LAQVLGMRVQAPLMVAVGFGHCFILHVVSISNHSGPTLVPLPV